MKDNLTIGKRMKAIRNEKKLSQQKLADLMGIDRGLLGQIEINNTKPNLIILSKFVKITNSSYNYLIDGIEPNNEFVFFKEYENNTSSKKVAPKVAPNMAPKGEILNETVHNVSDIEQELQAKISLLTQEISELKEKLRYADLALELYQINAKAFEDMDKMKGRLESLENKINKAK